LTDGPDGSKGASCPNAIIGIGFEFPEFQEIPGITGNRTGMETLTRMFKALLPTGLIVTLGLSLLRCGTPPHIPDATGDPSVAPAPAIAIVVTPS
jgi:hypothetical protein